MLVTVTSSYINFSLLNPPVRQWSWQTTTNVTYLDPLSLHANAQLWVFPDPSLDDVRDVLQGRREVLQPIMAESSVVGEVRVVPMLDIAISLCYLHRDNSIEQLSSVAPDHLLGRAKLRQRLAVPEKF